MVAAIQRDAAILRYDTVSTLSSSSIFYPLCHPAPLARMALLTSPPTSPEFYKKKLWQQLSSIFSTLKPFKLWQQLQGTQCGLLIADCKT